MITCRNDKQWKIPILKVLSRCSQENRDIDYKDHCTTLFQGGNITRTMFKRVETKLIMERKYGIFKSKGEVYQVGKQILHIFQKTSKS